MVTLNGYGTQRKRTERTEIGVFPETFYMNFREGLYPNTPISVLSVLVRVYPYKTAQVSSEDFTKGHSSERRIRTPV